MMNLLEIMQAAQGGNAYNNLANQFGIAPEQAQEAVKAVLPAFSMGLQQQAETMEGWQNILASLGQAQQSAEFFDSDGDGIPDHLESQGQNALGAMLGTPELTQHIASQSAQFAGLPANLMQQMLPVIASMVMGGLFKGAANSGLGGLLGQMMQGGAQGGAMGGGAMGGGGMGGMGGLGSILGGLFGQGMAPQNQAGPMGGMGGGMGGGGALGNILGSLLGGGQPAQPQNQGMGGNMGGMGGMLGSVLGGMMGANRAPTPQAAPEDPMSAGLDALKGMFQAGHQAQNQQLDALQQIFAQFRQR